jgi:hypothetical protein
MTMGFQRGAKRCLFWWRNHKHYEWRSPKSHSDTSHGEQRPKNQCKMWGRAPYGGPGETTSATGGVRPGAID